MGQGKAAGSLCGARWAGSRWSAAGALLLAAALSGCGKTAREYFDEARTARTVEDAERLLTAALREDPTLHQARFERAWLYARGKNYDAALADYEVLRKSSRSAYELGPIYYRRGLTLAASGRLPEAAESYSAALMIDPGYLNSYAARAAVFFQMSNYPDAVEDYGIMLKRDIARDGEDSVDRRAEWHLHRAVAAFCTGDWSTADADFRDAFEGTRSAARKAEAVIHRYFVACRTGQTPLIADHLSSYAGDTLAQYGPGQRNTPWILSALWYVAGHLTEPQFLEASKHTNKETEARQRAAAYYYVGARCLAKGENDKAREALQKCADQKDTARFEYHLAKVELDRLAAGGKTACDYAMLARQAPTNDKKIELYSLALRVDPAYTDARLNRAILYSLTGQLDLAIDDYTKLLEEYRRPANRATALRYRGQTYAQKGDHLAAIKDCTAALQDDPDLWEARHGLAASLCHVRRYKEAVEAYTDLANLVAARGLRWYWHTERAFASCCAGEWKAALQDFQAVLKADPAAPILQTNHYLVRCRLDDRVEAGKEFRSYALKPKPGSWENSVACFVADALPDGAAGLLKVSEHSEKDVTVLRTARAYYYIGAVALLKGKVEEARQAFEKCAEFGRQAKLESWEYRMALAELARKQSGK